MVEALLFWALALYGAVTVTWQCTRRLKHRSQTPHPLTFILIVKDAQQQIEGVVRGLMMRTALSARERQILVIDWASEDETPQILHNLAQDIAGLHFVRVADNEAFLRELQSACLTAARVGCIYDLRRDGLTSDVSADLATLCQ